MGLQQFDLENYTDFKKSMYIEASAGTGKTYTITGIIQKLIDAEIDLEKILVVTYTDKAAGELRNRIRIACPNKDVDNASIFTIHSFCQKTLSEFYFTAKQCANLSLVADTDVEDFIDRWIRDVLKKDLEFQLLFESSAKESTFINNLKRDFKQALSKYYLNTEGKEDKEIVSLDDFYINITKTAFIHDFTYQECDSLLALAETDYTSIKKEYDHAFSRIGSDTNVKKVAEYKVKRFYLSQIKKLYLAWQNEKEKNKAQSYDDMLRNVREAVCEKNSELKKQLQKKYTYAIIDEFQDTNQKQWDIFKTIFMEDKDHILIVVGDPKQSIYAFQGADVNVYSNAVRSIADNGGAPYSLQTNYRSTNAMVEACNCLFKDFFDEKSNITFTDSKASGKKNPAKYCGKEIKPFWIAGSPDNNTTEKDFAKITVQTIVDCCSFENGKTKLQVSTKDGLRNVGFHDFAILARSSSELKETERALKKAGVPYLRYKDGNLFFGKECLQWIALINAITAKDFTSTNRRLLNEALFSDFFCISIDQVDNEKYDNPSCAERQLIIQWKQLAQQRKWAKLFEKIYADTDIENRLSSLDQMQSLSKIRQIGNYVLDYLYKNDSSLEDVSKHLSRLSNDSDSSMDEGDIVEKGTDFDCVQLMTIHASKGLEFPVVIVPAGLRARNNNVPQAFLYHDDKNNSKLSFSPYGKDLSIKEEDFERQRIFYVAYTRASSLLVLPFYDKWDPVTNKETGKLYSFLNKSISSLFEEENKKFIEEISDKGKTYKELQTDVQALLAENKKLKEKEKGSQFQKEISQDAQLAATKELSSKVPSLAIHKHSYSSLSHKKAVTEEMTENGGRADKEGADLQPLSLSDYDASENPVSYNALPDSQGTCPLAAKAPYNFPKGARLGIALHEVFEKADFKTEENDKNLQHLIRSCFEKQTLSIAADDPDGWLTYTSSILWNTLNAKLPEISGAAQTGNYFSLSQLADNDKISEAEFNMNADISKAASELLKNYCNGFIDLVFKRSVNGKEVYSILDWKSDTFEADQYSDGALLKAHTDDRYSIQRVLYSYSLIKWLNSFNPEKNEEEIFENHFGGIYYAYVRGCQANTCSGIYARTWKNWQELESAFKKIMGAEDESR